MTWAFAPLKIFAKPNDSCSKKNVVGVYTMHDNIKSGLVQWDPAPALWGGRYGHCTEHMYGLIKTTSAGDEQSWKMIEGDNKSPTSDVDNRHKDGTFVHFNIAYSWDMHKMDKSYRPFLSHITEMPA